MEIKQIKELLANPDVRQVIEEQLAEAVTTKQAELDSKIKELEEQKKSNEKQLFILRKTILAKSNLYEGKLKELYEGKFQEAKKKLGKEVYSFINDSVKTLTEAVSKEVEGTSSSTKMQEAFASAVRAMAPFMNINELVGNDKATVTALEARVNELTGKVKTMSDKSLKADMFELTVSECTGYPSDKLALIWKTVSKMEPKSLTEGKQAVLAAKEALKKREQELSEATTVTSTTLAEGTAASAATATQAAPQRAKLKIVASEIKAEKEVIEESIKTAKPTLDGSAVNYDFTSL